MPPVQLENQENQGRVDYVQDVASQPDFDYPTVCTFVFPQTIMVMMMKSKQ